MVNYLVDMDSLDLDTGLCLEHFLQSFESLDSGFLINMAKILVLLKVHPKVLWTRSSFTNRDSESVVLNLKCPPQPQISFTNVNTVCLFPRGPL